MLTVLKLTVLIAPGDDILRHHARQASNAGQQRHGSGIQIDTDGVHAVFHHRIQLARQLRLANIVLILAHADRFRIDFHQLRQRILQTTGDRHRATQRNIEIRELQRRQLGSRVNRCPGFADDHLLRGHFRELFLHVEEETLGFARRRTVTNRDQLNVVFFTQRRHGNGGFGCLAGMRINSVGRDQLAGTVNHRHFYAGTQSRIETHCGSQPGRGGHQQVMQVTGKDVDRFIFRTFTYGTHQLSFKVHQHFDAPRPANNAFTPAVSGGVVQAQSQVILDNLLAVALFWRLIELRIGI